MLQQLILKPTHKIVQDFRKEANTHQVSVQLIKQVVSVSETVKLVRETL
jgi:hypothetical protein